MNRKELLDQIEMTVVAIRRATVDYDGHDDDVVEELKRIYDQLRELLEVC